MRTKYLILDNLSSFGSTTGPIVFPEFEEHGRVAENYGGKEHVLAAGFVQVHVKDGKLAVSCFGKSVSLGKESRGDEDARQVRRMFVEYD